MDAQGFILTEALAQPGNGPLAGGQSEDLNFTLLRWAKGMGVDEHSNQEVDVLMVVLQGKGRLRVDGKSQPLIAGQAVLIPKGADRQINSDSEDFCYLNVHQRRRGLMPGKIEDRPR